MSMTETPATEQPTKPKRKPRRSKRAAQPRPASELAGLTVSDCPKACNAERCVISGHGVCAHPRKGGLQGRSMHDNAALARLNQAQKMLGKKNVDARFS